MPKRSVALAGRFCAILRGGTGRAVGEGFKTWTASAALRIGLAAIAAVVRVLGVFFARPPVGARHGEGGGAAAARG